MGAGNGTRIFSEAALAFYSSVVGRGGGGRWIDDDRPTMTWEITHSKVGSDDESAQIKVGGFSPNWQQPVSVKMWHATTLDNKRRDWRLFDCVHEHGCTQMEADPGRYPAAGPMPHPCIYREGCASLALAALPLIFSYKSEKSLCGTGRSLRSRRTRTETLRISHR